MGLTNCFISVYKSLGNTLEVSTDTFNGSIDDFLLKSSIYDDDCTFNENKIFISLAKSRLTKVHLV